MNQKGIDINDKVLNSTLYTNYLALPIPLADSIAWYLYTMLIPVLLPCLPRCLKAKHLAAI